MNRVADENAVVEGMVSPGSRANAVDILCVGCQKSATSWAAHVLNLHDNVWIPKQFALSNKEVMFWDRYYKRGLRWYKQIMTPPAGHMKSMDISPGYSRVGPGRAALCYKQSPGARLFLLLRNPIYRDWSSLLMEATLRHKFDIAGARFVDLMVFYDRANVSQFSTYDTTFSVWRKPYGGQLLVGLYDDIVADAKAFYERLCAHCGLDPNAVPNWQERIERRVFKGPDIELPAQMHEFLLKKYRPMILKLQDLIDRDLSDWLCAEPKIR
ncbi:MAG: hypothetical protein ACT4SY_01085 [Hyphomicrobiales bacterium]